MLLANSPHSIHTSIRPILCICFHPILHTSVSPGVGLVARQLTSLNIYIHMPHSPYMFPPHSPYLRLPRGRLNCLLTHLTQYLHPYAPFSVDPSLPGRLGCSLTYITQYLHLYLHPYAPFSTHVSTPFSITMSNLHFFGR